MLAVHLRPLLAPLTLLACAILACNLTPSLPATPTPVPSAFAPGNPTFVPPAWLTGTPTPFRPTPAGASPTPTLPTAAPAATSTAIASLAPPEEAILILSPGPNSQITSPVTITGISDPVFENQLGVKILDESGKTVGSGTAFITAPLGERGPFEAVVEFTPPTSPQPGRVVVYDTSARDGHITHLSSVNVTLLPAGSAADLKPGLRHPEDIVIQSPAFLETVSGGVVQVSGIAAPIFEQTLVVDVLDVEGKVVGQAALIVPGEPGQPAHFEGDVTYTVAGEQRGAIQFYYTSPRDGGIVHLVSVEVALKP